jgi:subtilisin family serine protease
MLVRFEAVLVVCFVMLGSIAFADIHNLSTTEVGVTQVPSMGYLDMEPNDPFFGQQWSLHNTGQTGGTTDADIDALEAWDVEAGSSDIVVAIVDSGIDFHHPDLVDNIWTNSGEVPDNGNDDDGNGYIDDVHGYDFHNEHNDSLPEDTMGHGTSMAGIIAAVTDNGIGMAGIAYNCKIMPIKIFDKDALTTASLVAEGIRYAADNGAKVICMALAFPFSISSLKEAVDYAYEKGVFICAGAGNFDNNHKTYPAAFDHVAAVAATDHNDQRMEYYFESNGVWANSTYGDWVDIAAPGEDLLTTLPTYYVEYMNGIWGYPLNYGRGSGVTLATPVVAGVAALVYSKNPSYSPGKITAILKANSDPYDAEYYLGVGRVNAYKALMELNAEPMKPDRPVGPSSGTVNEHYEYSASSYDADGDQLYYLFDWGDGNDSGWLGPFDAHSVCTASHNWSGRGDYSIRVKARDIFGLESDWSDPLPVSMPLHRYTILEKIIEWILNLFKMPTS